MRYALLSVALCAAVQAAPLQSFPVTDSQLDNRDNILLGRNGYVAGQEQSARQPRSYEPENDIWYPAGTATTTPNEKESLSITTTTPSPASHSDSAFIGDEDPQLLQILVHVETILHSAASPEEQVQWMLDAIVHHTEAMRETNANIWSDEEVMDIVNALLDEDFPDEEKVDIIFNQLIMHTKFKAVAGPPSREPVLLRIRAVLYGKASNQQKIKSILDEIAHYLSSEDVVPAWMKEQVTMSDVDGVVDAIDAADTFSQGQEAADVEEDAQSDWQDNSVFWDDEDLSSI